MNTFFWRLILEASLATLVAASISFPQPPEEPGHQFRRNDLVEVRTLDSTIRIDVRYATTNNFMHRPIYEEARVLLQRPAAEALIRVNRNLRRLGFGLLLFDGYRPWSVTKQFWDETSPAQHRFVADPEKGSNHNRGCAVDLSLVDLHTGREIRMPSPYDDFTPRAYSGFRGGTSSERRMRDLLRREMEHAGFRVNKYEWWHFDYHDWKAYRVLDIPFDKLH